MCWPNILVSLIGSTSGMPTHRPKTQRHRQGLRQGGRFLLRYRERLASPQPLFSQRKGRHLIKLMEGTVRDDYNTLVGHNAKKSVFGCSSIDYTNKFSCLQLYLNHLCQVSRSEIKCDGRHRSLILFLPRQYTSFSIGLLACQACSH